MSAKSDAEAPDPVGYGIDTVEYFLNALEQGGVGPSEGVARAREAIRQLREGDPDFAQESVWDGRAILESILDSISDGVIGIDQDGRCSFSNKAATEILGIDPENSSLRDWSNSQWCFVSDAGQACVTAELPAVRALHGDEVENGQVFIRRPNRPDGVWVSIDARPLRDHQGVVKGSLCIIHDITEAKKREAELRDRNRELSMTIAELKSAQQQVIRQERLRAFGQMASGVAHDFNNALTVIQGITELLKCYPDYLNDGEKLDRYLGMIDTAARDAGDVVRRLRKFYRGREENEVRQLVCLNSLVEEAISLTEPRWRGQAQASGATIRVSTELDELPRIAANESELREVLTNLIFNAVDAMPQGGTITVRTDAEGDMVSLAVSDTGTGMTDEVREHCFDPFFTTKGPTGTGLGLASVYGIIQRHGGTMDVDGEEGVGTSFTLRLPIGVEQEDVESDQEPGPRCRPLNLLVVDDDPMVLEILRDLLAADGHLFETAGDGREALEKFHMGWFDLVLTDLAMPEMNGDKLATAIKRIAPDKPVVLLTGFGDGMKASDTKPKDVDLLVGKPVTVSKLRKALALAE